MIIGIPVSSLHSFNNGFAAHRLLVRIRAPSLDPGQALNRILRGVDKSGV